MLSSLFYGLAHLSSIILNLVSLLIIVSVAIGWFQADPRNPYVQMVKGLTEPFYRPIRRWTQAWTGPVDLAPMILMLFIVFLQKSLPTYLMSLSFRF